jgi:integrase
MKLTKRVIDGLRFEPDGPIQQIIWDDEVRGLGVRLQPGGTKTYVLKYRTRAGRGRTLSIGRHGVLTLEQARERAIRLKVKVADGKDPADDRQAEKRQLTLREFALDVYLPHAEAKGKRTADADRSKLERDVLPRYGSRKLASIARADVAAIHSRVGKRAPIAANRLAALLSAMRGVAIEKGHLPEDTPRWSVSPFPERKRDRWITPAELPHLLTAIDAEQSPHVRAALMLLLLTGMRRGEVLGLRWSYVDLDRREIRLPHTKAGRSHTIPLVQDAVELLRELPRFVGNPYVLPSPEKAGKPMHDLKRPWDRVRARLWLAQHPEEAEQLRERAAEDVAARSKHFGAHDGRDPVRDRLLTLAMKEVAKEGDRLRLHDVRRTTGSMLAMAGASLPLIGKVLNHSNTSTTQIYARLMDDAPRTALEEVASRVREARAG